MWQSHRLRVSYNNSLCKLFNLPYDCIVSGMCVIRCIPSYNEIVYKCTWKRLWDSFIRFCTVFDESFCEDLESAGFVIHDPDYPGGNGLALVIILNQMASLSI